MQGIVSPAHLDLVETLTLAVSTAHFDDLRALIAADPRVMRKDVAYDLIVRGAQEAFAKGYRFPYWM